MDGLPTSTPSIQNYDPHVIPYHYEVIKAIRKDFDYSIGVHEILLSGSLGSGKSTLLAHIAITHCLFNRGARFLLGRLSMPSLKQTIFNKVLEHIGNDLIEGKDFTVNMTNATIKFANGSEIISRSWSDNKFFKVRSIDLSGVAIEETTETDEDDFYREIRMRVGRLPHVKENIIVHATNPGSPTSWVYKYFIDPNIGDIKHPTKHVYYSLTAQNPFLPPQYLDQLKRDLDPKLARRMLYGEWIDIRGEVVYYEYDRETQFINRSYEVNKSHAIILTWDFNIGEGKPMSVCCMQYYEDAFHIFAEVIIQGSRTADTIEELDGKGLLLKDYKYIICGDASGKHRDTRSSQSDYDIIRKELSSRNLNFEYHVPLANPPVRTRHNRVNAYCKNMAGDTRLFIYKDAKTCDEAMRLTKLKPGANYIEDDSKAYQHVGTAIGYAIMSETQRAQRKPQGTILL